MEAYHKSRDDKLELDAKLERLTGFIGGECFNLSTPPTNPSRQDGLML